MSTSPVPLACGGVAFAKEGNCFTAVADPADRWIYGACLCFGLDLADQEGSRFVYNYAVYQVEYSHNLLFRSGAQMEATFDAIVDRTRSRLDFRHSPPTSRRPATGRR